MSGISSKIARLAVSKAAAFCYAVAVGVAGNLAFNFVQQHRAPPAAATPAPEIGAPADAGSRPAAANAKIPEPPARRGAAAALTPVALPPLRQPAPARLPGTAPVLPEPPAVQLPGPDTLRAPELKPTPLPPPEQAARPQPEAPRPPAPATSPGPPASQTAAQPSPPPLSAPEAAATASLPPIGTPIEVAPPPVPPERPDIAPTPHSAQPSAAALPRFPSVPPAAPAPAAENSQDWRFSDFWHPGRAVAKGLHWAGEQLPAIGSDGAAAHDSPPAPAAPIPLLPAGAQARAAETTGALVARPKPAAPGPGSGGLY